MECVEHQYICQVDNMSDDHTEYFYPKNHSNVFPSTAMGWYSEWDS
jgi:hypothetical protein